VTHPFAPLARCLAARSVRYVLIGVSGANLYGPAGQAVFSTDDLDLFLPQDADNLVRAWEACEVAALDLCPPRASVTLSSRSMPRHGTRTDTSSPRTRTRLSSC
jgi:hypothetical protein